MFYLTSSGKLLQYQFSYLDHLEEGQLDKTKPNHLSQDEWENISQKRNDNEARFRASDIMSSTITSVGPLELITNIEKVFRKNNFRHIPVVKDNIIIGMISNQDLLKYKGDGGFNYLKSKDIMSQLIICTDEQTPIFKISKVLVREKINCLPVVNSIGEIKGIVTTSDILKLTVEQRFLS